LRPPPGAAVVGALLFVLSPFTDLSTVGSFGGGLALLLGCYIVGHVLRATVGEWVKPVKPSAELLSSGSEAFSAVEKARIVRTLNSAFTLDLPEEPNDKQQQAAFDLAYTTIVQHNVAGYVPLYNSLYALYRGLLAASWVSWVIVSAHLAYWVGRGFPITLHTGTSVVLFVVLFLLSWGVPGLQPSPLRKQLDRYARTFALAVYRNFLVWRGTIGLLG
jgi:hypothetical protein